MRRRSRVLFAFAASVAAAALAPTDASAQTPDQARQAAYSTDQAQAGAAVYQAACVMCHLPNLAGSFEAPELAGANFRNTWGARSVSDLLELTRETMPPEAPRSLDEGQYVALAAYILRQNGVAPAQARMSLSSSGRVIGGTGAVGATAAGGVEPTGHPETSPRPPTRISRIRPTETGSIGAALRERRVTALSLRSPRRTSTASAWPGCGAWSPEPANPRSLSGTA